MTVNRYLNDLMVAWQSVDTVELNEAVTHVYRALINGEIVLIAGNGGSAATASHFVNDWTKGISQNIQLPIRAISLADNTPTLSAIANDISYDEIFSRQITNYGGLASTLICISGSGNSVNLLKAAELARSLGMKVIGLLGYDGGALKSLCNLSFHCEINDMQIVEDMHLTFGHMVLRESV